MSLTRIGSIGINTGIAFAGVTTIVTLNTANDALSIGATVNVGSGITLGASGDIFATGVSTFSGNLKVGSGVTISPDGDGFYTGVVTATTFSGSLAASNLTGALPAISGANLTNLDASDLASGTVPTARLGSGTASSSTFLRGDSTFATVTSTTINSNTNNYLITGTGTANTLQGEANLTFDGDDLLIRSSTDGRRISFATDGTSHYMKYDDTLSGIILNGYGGIAFETNGTNERLRIDSSGRLLVAATSASSANSGADDLVIGNTSQGNNGMSIVTNNANIGGIYFADQDNAVRGGVRYQHASDLAQFYAGGNVILNLKNKGVGINESSPTEDALTIRGGDTDDTPRLILKRATDGTQVDGEIIGKLQFMSNENNVDSGNYQPRVEIHGVTVSTSGAAKMDFYTVPNSTTTPLKRMTINQTGVVTIPNQPSFSAHTTNTTSANTDVVFNATVTNIGSHYSTSNGRFTAPVAGNYYFGFYGMSPHADSTNIRCYFKINGAAHSSGQMYGGVGYAGGTPSNGYTHISMETILPLSANDYVNVYWQNTSMHSEHCKFNGFLIG